MRLVRRQELLQLPAGTLFCELREPWVFGGLELKQDTLPGGGDFWVRLIDWPDSDDTGIAIDRLDEMLADSSVSYPVDEAHQRYGLYDDEQVYLVYEQSDAEALIADLRKAYEL